MYKCSKHKKKYSKYELLLLNYNIEPFTCIIYFTGKKTEEIQTIYIYIKHIRQHYKSVDIYLHILFWCYFTYSL